VVILVMLAAAFAALAAAFWWLPCGSVRGRLPARSPMRVPASGKPVMAVGAGLSVLVLVNGITGLLMGVALAFGLHQWMTKHGSRDDRARLAKRSLALPVALDVLAACFTVGAAQQQGLDAVATSIGGSLGDDLRVVSRALGAGAEAHEAWTLIDAPDLLALGAILSRAETSGAPVTPLLALLADQQRQRARGVAMDAARALGVRVTGPLGLCFLPAFILVAVVPLVISLLPMSL
jgi:Flp pilus assembly protein TadB